jgi:N6-L-threonylcarbamoyladenine synthase
MLDSGDYNFSFSGLKTSVRYLIPKLHEFRMEDLCASFQEAIVEVLVTKTMRAATDLDRQTVAVSGGVICNTRLRERFVAECGKRGLELLLAEPKLCTDNAAMIAFAAAAKLRRNQWSSIETDIDPNLRLVS